MDDHDWRRVYAGKVATAEEAIRLIPAGRRILIGSGAAEPVSLVEAMVEPGGHLVDCEIVHLLTLGPAPYVRPELQGRFRHVAFFIGPNVRDAVNEGRADFLPVFLSEVPELFRSRRVRIDVAMIQVSPPDAHGYVSLGLSVDVVRAAVETAELVLAEVNPRMPRTHGDSFVPVAKIDRLVPVDTPLLALQVDPPGEVEREIGRHVATLVPDGATLQAGIGQIPDAALAALRGRKDLGVHTEMLSDGMMALADAGVVTGRAKSLLPGKIVTSFIMGSERLYAWADDHPAVEMRPSDFTNDPQIIARNDRMVSINSALAVDLTGQIAADTLSGRFFSGIGGQVDFVRGASRSRGGRAIIALPSTARGGTVSRIQPALEEGAGVVTSRGDVRYVVTEYGVADLWGKTVRQRAHALIEIAHPSFRPELLAAARRRRYVFPDQPLARAASPWKEERRLTLPDGAAVVLRPVRTGDGDAVRRMLLASGTEDLRRLAPAAAEVQVQAEVRRLADLDDESNMAIVAISERGSEILGFSRYDVDPATRLADVSLVVREDVQCRGIGTLLVRRMIEIARARGVTGFRANVQAGNKAIFAVLHKTGLRTESRLDGDVFHVIAWF